MNRVIKSLVIALGIFGSVAAGAGIASAESAPQPVINQAADTAIVDFLGNSTLPEHVQHALDPAAIVLITGDLSPYPIERPVEAGASLTEQVAATQDLFETTTVTPDYNRCDNPITLDDKAACGIAIVERNNYDQPVAEVHLIGRYAFDFVNEENNCIGTQMTIGYCDSTISMSRPMMDGVSTTGTASLNEVTGVLAHENGHYTDDLQLQAQGSSLDEYTDQAPDHANGYKAENNGDRQMGWVLGNAELSGDLTAGAIDEVSAMIGANSSDADPTHGGAATRDAMMRQGAALAGTYFLGMFPLS
ncbi:MAG: hypothetical protein EON58_14825 [Alphaproteobacteria bacterium]|nr:MAG: hypothetical protein EON58_14825 [Alphaproteobacteria bacterium]